MNLTGAVIGAIIGFVVGGPIGALVGAVLGQSLSVGVSSSGWSGYDAAAAQQAFFTATFSVMGHIAKADGRVSENEIQTVRAFMAHMNLDAQQQQAAIALFNQGKEPGFDLDGALKRFRTDCRGRFDLLSMFVEFQLHVALADGPMHPAERQTFGHICAVLGFSEFQLRRLEEFILARRSFHEQGPTAAARVDSLAAAYQTLGVSPQASDADVKTAYRRLMKENHPDKLVARGLPEQMIKLAQEKVQQINVAYEAIKNSRGMK
ncbi:MAG: co-chaperone DjlA [Bacillota bacterium]